MPHLAHFPCPGENGPYMWFRFTFSAFLWSTCKKRVKTCLYSCKISFSPVSFPVQSSNTDDVHFVSMNCIWHTLTVCCRWAGEYYNSTRSTVQTLKRYNATSDLRDWSTCGLRLLHFLLLTLGQSPSSHLPNIQSKPRQTTNPNMHLQVVISIAEQCS